MWFVTTVEKMEPYDDDPTWADYGETRCWAFYSDKKKATQSLHENWTDMRENFWNYAVIEEYEEGICNDTGNRQWFKWDEERQGYFEIDESEGVRRIVCFAIG